MSKIPSLKKYVVYQTTKLYAEPRNTNAFKNHTEKLYNYIKFIERDLNLSDFIKNDDTQPMFKNWEIISNTGSKVKIGLKNAHFFLTWCTIMRTFQEQIKTIEDIIVYELDTNLTFD